MPLTGGGSRVPTSVAQFRPGQPGHATREDRSRAPGNDDGDAALRGGRAARGRIARVRLRDADAAEREPRRGVSGSQQLGGESVVVRVRGDAELAGVRARRPGPRALREDT